jgi:serine protease Do
MESAIYSTVRITSSYDIRDKFNPEELDSHGKGIGTGFFIDENGHILTCYHVIEHSVKIFINLPNAGKKSYKARIISVYPELDLAIIKIHNYENKHYIKLGSSDECRMGSDTIAIGYPLGDDDIKTTKGTISGKKDYLIQTDTTINPGNSGGPLLNNKYEAIGINSSKMVGQSTEGTGYIVPINIFKTVMDQMMASPIKEQNTGPEPDPDPDPDPEPDQINEKIHIVYKPNLYCEYQILDNGMMDLLTKQTDKKIEGVMISMLYKNSPLVICDKGMNVNDILMEFDEKKIDIYGDISTNTMLGDLDLDSYVLRCSTNKKINIKYYSAKTQEIINTSIILKNEYLYKIPEIFYPQKIEYLNVSGIIICQLTLDHILDIVNFKYSGSMKCQPSMFKYILKENREEPKIFISSILPNSNSADNKNFENNEGCIISKVNGKKVSTINDFKDAYKYNILVNGKKYVYMQMITRQILTLSIE